MECTDLVCPRDCLIGIDEVSAQSGGDGVESHKFAGACGGQRTQVALTRSRRSCRCRWRRWRWRWNSQSWSCPFSWGAIDQCLPAMILSALMGEMRSPPYGGLSRFRRRRWFQADVQRSCARAHAPQSRFRPSNGFYLFSSALAESRLRPTGRLFCL